MAAAHEQKNRPRPDDIAANYAIDDQLCNPAPQIIGLFDDVLTTGAHFRAASNILNAAYAPAFFCLGPSPCRGA
jgi:predicted amidophosphoribosyltransferase